MKRVLIIAYYWPPAGGSGVQRCLKFAKFLPEFDWEPVVYTCENPAAFTWDHSLEKDVPEDLEVHKTRIFEPFELYKKITGQGKDAKVTDVMVQTGQESTIKKAAIWLRGNLYVPDAKVGWVRPSVQYLTRYLRKNPVDMILSSGPPHSVHLIGQKLHKQFGTPWVADFRDPWTNIYSNRFMKRTAAAERRDLKHETSVLHEANAISVVSPGLEAEFGDRAQRVAQIYNGYDPDDIPTPSSVSREYFELCYTGNYKANQDLPELWSVIKELSAEIPGFSDEFRLHLVGKVANNVCNSLGDAGIDSMVRYTDSVPHQEAVEFMVDSELLLFPIPLDKTNKLILTGKIFEYLASRSEILGIGPVDGNAARILSDADRHGMIDYCDRAQLKDRLRTSFLRWKEKGSALRHDGDAHERYSRRGLTGQLAQLFNELV
ncbi:glycosyl transferase family 1 [Cryomorphaceae bacterium]|nr:glycosyl transferase family 1 [Cryomorphaceae bacterium]